MKTVVLAAALTGSCAVFYFLYNMKVNSKERRSTSKKNKGNGLQSNMHKKEQMEKDNARNNLGDTGTVSNENSDSRNFHLNNTESPISSQDESTSSSKIIGEEISNSDIKMDSEIFNSYSESSKIKEGISSSGTSEVLNSISDTNKIEVEINSQMSKVLNSHLFTIEIKEKISPQSSLVFNSHSETTVIEKETSSQDSESLSSHSQPFKLKEGISPQSSDILNLHSETIKIEDEINSQSSGILNTHLVDTDVKEINIQSSDSLNCHLEATEIKEETSSNKCHNLIDETKAHSIVSSVENDVKSVSENDANMCHITLSQVPEKEIKNDIQLPSPTSESMLSVTLSLNLVENNSVENSSVNDAKALEPDLAGLINLSEFNESCSKDVQTNIIQPQETNIKSASSEQVQDTVTKSEKQFASTEVAKPVIPATEVAKPVIPATEVAKPVIPATEVAKPVIPAKSKKQRQRERKRAAKAKANNVPSKEVTPKLEDSSFTEASCVVMKEPKVDPTENPTENLPCKTNIKDPFWSVKETPENIENGSKHTESTMLACSPDHICTSDLEREASQTPEHENITSDSQSLASFDSGQGSIDQETIFLNMILPEGNSEYYITYQFEVPQLLVGKLIGKKGAFLNKLKAATSTNIVVVNHADKKYKLCSVEGKKWQVLQALDFIREHFPCEQFPELSLSQVNVPSPQHQPQMNRQLLQVELPPGVVLEVQASAVISTGEVWLQQPLHPTFSALQRLHQCLNLNYGDGSSTPTVPFTIPPGTVCVCQIGDQWLRCQVVEHDETQSTVCLLDVGGHFSLPFTLLRQIRVDYVSLPFQATRCYLYGIEPSSDNGWEEEGRLALQQLSKNSIIYATIAAYSQDGIPLVNLYQRQFNQYTFINEKLVEMDHAKWISAAALTEST